MRKLTDQPPKDSANDFISGLKAVENRYRDRGGSTSRNNRKDSQNEVSLASRVRVLREKLGLSQAQFAARYGLDLATLRGWEHGRRKPDKANRTLLAAIGQFPGVIEKVAAGQNSDESEREKVLELI